MAKRNTVRLTEAELKNIIKESVKNVLKEGKWDGDGDYTKTMEVQPGQTIHYRSGYGSQDFGTKYHPEDIKELYKEYAYACGDLAYALKGTLRDSSDKVVKRMNSTLKMVKLLVNSSEVMAPVKSPVVYDNGENKLQSYYDDQQASWKRFADRQRAINDYEKRMNKYYDDNADTFVDMAREEF